MKQFAVLLALAASAVAQTSFSATIRVYDDPNVRGIMTGTMQYAPGKEYYSWDGIGVENYIDFDNDLTYMRCSGSCVTTSENGNQRILYAQGETGHDAIDINGVSCLQYDKAGGLTIWMNGNTICRAKEADGTTTDFTNVGAYNGVTNYPTAWSCPGRVCRIKMDLVLSIDESGSINAAEFEQWRTFARSIVQSYTIGPDDVAIGIYRFSCSSNPNSLIIRLSTGPQSVLNAVNGMGRTSPHGCTCISCGIDYSTNEFAARGRYKPTGERFPRVMILLTDGEPTEGNYVAATGRAEAAGIFRLCVGVDGADIDVLRQISSNVPGKETSFYVSGFNQLQAVVSSLITLTCTDPVGNPCGPGCSSFCACGVCVCPTLCDDASLCTADSCPSGAVGCVYNTISCDDGNSCTYDSCNSGTGCINDPVPANDCDDNNVCTNDSCNSNQPFTPGCIHTDITTLGLCDDQKSCTDDGCNAVSGCTHTTIPSCSNNKCLDQTTFEDIICPRLPCHKRGVCDVNTGDCINEPIVCDHDQCNTAACVPNSPFNASLPDSCQLTAIDCDDGNPCTIDGCDPLSGCTHDLIDAEVYCNDYDNCTIDTCEPTATDIPSKPGCVNTAVNCSGIENATLCTPGICDPISGLCYLGDPRCEEKPNLRDFMGDCYTAECLVEKGGCVLVPLPTAKIDKCGVCNGNGKKCAFNLESAPAAALGGLFIAAIVLAVLAAVAAIFLLAGKKGYDIYLASKGGLANANQNPLYNDAGMSGKNPMYEGSN